MRRSLVVVLIMLAASPTLAQSDAGLDLQPPAMGSALGRSVPLNQGSTPFDCGDLHYDDGSAENSIFFGGGQAGEIDHFLGVRFELADFDLQPRRVVLTGFCISNSLDLTSFGGPWPNEVFVYRDVEGVPQLSDPQRQATVVTGDGTGQVEVRFDQPWLVDDPVFWLMIHGFPQHAGEDFNMESDQSSEPANRSWIADRGVAFMIPTEQNFMLRASVEVLPGSAEPVPVMTGWALVLLPLLMIALLFRRRVDARSA